MADRLRFAFATAADDAELRGLLRTNPMRGAIDVAFTHEPDYFRGVGLGGADDVTLLAREDGRLVAAGRCTTRACWVNGEIRRVAYLGELRLDASVQGRWDIVREGYAFFAESYARQPAEFCFTSIVADNTRARQLFERGVRGLPRYAFLGDYTTLVLPAARGRPPAGLEVTDATGVPPQELADFLNAAARCRQLALYWTPDILAQLAMSGLGPEAFVVLRHAGRMVACAGVWDQRAFRQVRIVGYRPPLSAVRPFYNVVAPLAGQPRLPPPGSILNQALLTPFAWNPVQAGAQASLLQAVRQSASRRGFHHVVLGETPDAPWLGALRGRRYASRLYRVCWPGVPPAVSTLDERPCLPDIGLL